MPTNPAKSISTVSTGIITVAASKRGSTSMVIASTPMVASASNSWLTFMVPISAANAEPLRPASTIAVSSGPSSRTTPRATRLAT